MPTNASILADYASGIGTQGTTLTIDGDLKRVGIGTTLPTSTLDVNGDVTGVTTMTVANEVYATQFFGNVVGDVSGDVTGNADTATYADVAGIATYATNSGIATYATNSGIATYADVAGIATYATNSGIATYADVAGIATVAENLTGNPTISVTDITATGNVSIAGTLTYEDVTNVDSIGIITSRTGVRVLAGGVDISGGGLSVTGVSTFNDNLDLQDNDRILLGTDDDLQIYHDGFDSYIVDSGEGNLIMKSAGSFLLQGADNNENIIVGNQDGSVELWYDNSKKLETTGAGVTVTGNILPDGNGTRDLGASGTRWANVYTSDLDLSNEAKGGNNVDGTWGAYTIQEGENDLFLINRRTGKTYKFVLQEVN